MHQHEQEYEADIAALEAKYVAHPTGSVLFYGSSSVRLWPRLSRDFSAVALESWGFGGSTLAQCAHFFERVVTQRKPRALVFYAGDNDLALGATPEDVWRSLVALLDARDALGAFPLAFIALKPSPARAALLPRIIETNEWCWRETQSRHNTLWADVFDPMLDANRQPRRELFTADQLHLSRAGYDLWRRVLARDVPWLS